MHHAFDIQGMCARTIFWQWNAFVCTGTLIFSAFTGRCRLVFLFVMISMMLTMIVFFLATEKVKEFKCKRRCDADKEQSDQSESHQFDNKLSKSEINLIS